MFVIFPIEATEPCLQSAKKCKWVLLRIKYSRVTDYEPLWVLIRFQRNFICVERVCYRNELCLGISWCLFLRIDEYILEDDMMQSAFLIT